MLPIIVSIADARAVLGIGTTKLYELINERKLRTVKLGRRTLVRTDSINEYVDSLGERP